MVTEQRLRALVDRYNELQHGTTVSDLVVTIQWAYGRPRLFRADGAVEVSPRLDAREMQSFLEGMLTTLALQRI